MTETAAKDEPPKKKARLAAPAKDPSETVPKKKAKAKAVAAAEGSEIEAPAAKAKAKVDLSAKLQAMLEAAKGKADQS